MWSSNKAHDFFLDSIRNLKTIRKVSLTTKETALKKVHTIAIDTFQAMEDRSSTNNLQKDQKIELQILDGAGMILDYAITCSC